MSLTLTTVADALIEFILSLLRDPAASAEFDDDPEGMLAQRGLGNANASDVSAVAPIIIERTQVVQVVKPVPVAVEHHSNPVVREIKQVTTHIQWVDDRDTIVDQSVNQNIWAEGDVTQSFDQEAVVASGDDALAAGGDLDNEESLDQSTTIEAGEDVNLGNDTAVTIIEDSLNADTDASQETDASTDVVIDESGNDASTDVQLDESGNVMTEETNMTDVVVDATAVEDSAEVIVEEAPAEPEAAPEEIMPEGAGYEDSIAEYAESTVDDAVSTAFDEADVLLVSEGTDDDGL